MMLMVNNNLPETIVAVLRQPEAMVVLGGMFHPHNPHGILKDEAPDGEAR